MYRRERKPCRQSIACRTAVLLFVLKGERGGVDAVAQASGTRAIRKDVAEMAPAAGAGDFDAAHAEGAVFMLDDGLGLGGMVKLGQPHPESNLAPLRKSNAPQAAQW